MSEITWNWRFAGFGAVMAVVALITILTGEVLYGTFLLIGSIPAAIVGLAPKRKQRKVVLVVGLLFAFSILLGRSWRSGCHWRSPACSSCRTGRPRSLRRSRPVSWRWR